jgi:glycogen debranching enzyme-like protein
VTCAFVRPDTLCAWKGSSLLIVNTRGECGADQGLSGYYHREARFLRTLRLELDGRAPWLCEAAAVAPDALRFTYVHPEVADYGGGGSGQSQDVTPRNERGLPQRAIVIRTTYSVELNGLTVATLVENRSRETLDFELAWNVSADFADIQEAQSARRRQNAPVEVHEDQHGITFRYQHPDLPYTTRLHMAPGVGWQVTSQRAATRVRLPAAGSVDLGLRVVADGARHSLSDDGAARRERHLNLDALSSFRFRLTRSATPTPNGRR